MDLSNVSADDRKLLAAATKLYKERLREVVAQGDLYRLESPYDGPRAALEYVLPDRSRAVLFVYQLKDNDTKPVRPRGLDKNKRYLIREVNLAAGTPSQLASHETTVDGDMLMRDGLVPPCRKEFDSAVIELEAQ
jgi:alpha-galactosidase